MYPIPANATRIRYLKSTGSQYIDTGVVAGPNTRSETDIAVTWGSNTNYALSGCGTSRHVFGRGWTSGARNANLYIGLGGTNYDTGVLLRSLTGRHTYWIDAPLGKGGYDDTEFSISATVSENAFTSLLLAQRQTATGIRGHMTAKLYGCRYYQSGVLVRSFVPVRVGQVGCLFDRVSGQFFYNAGTGDFVCGDDDFSIFSYAVKHLSDTGTVLASSAMGDSSGTMKAVRKHYDMPVQYTIDECNGSSPTAVNVYFPSGTYDELDYTPTWSGHRFVGWYTTSATPSTTAPTSGTQVQKGDSVVFDRSTVYARWQLPTTVTFDATTNGGQMPSGWTAPDYYEGQPYGTLPAPTKSGEVFLGWYTSGGTRATESSAVTAGTLTARYAAVTYDTSFQVTTTSSYRKTGIYSAASRNSSNPTVVDWGDGTTDVVYGNISQLAHTYSSNGTFTVQVNDNISNIALSASDSTWYGTTSQNRYTVKKLTALGANITALPSAAFMYCSAMTDALLPSNSSFKTIPQNCFAYCTTLKPVTIPSTVTTITDRAFQYINGSQFTAVTIPAAVTSIGAYAFYQCAYLKSITFEASSSALTLGIYTFSYCFYQSSAVGTVDLSPRKISLIPNYCFNYCRYLKGVTWPQELKSIGSYAFRYCFYYTASTGTMEIPEGVTSISGTYAFANCLYLTAVTLPSTLTNLNNYTFYYCTRLATITSNCTTAQTVSSATFGNGSTYYTGRNSYSAGTNKLYVPAGATGYNASYWSSVLLNSTKCGFTLEYKT